MEVCSVVHHTVPTNFLVLLMDRILSHFTIGGSWVMGKWDHSSIFAISCE